MDSNHSNPDQSSFSLRGPDASNTLVRSLTAYFISEMGEFGIAHAIPPLEACGMLSESRCAEDDRPSYIRQTVLQVADYLDKHPDEDHYVIHGIRIDRQNGQPILTYGYTSAWSTDPDGIFGEWEHAIPPQEVPHP